MKEYQHGLFEIQDEGSQLLAAKIRAEEKMNILDFCAGSGGKTLGFVHKMKVTPWTS